MSEVAATRLSDIGSIAPDPGAGAAYTGSWLGPDMGAWTPGTGKGVNRRLPSEHELRYLIEKVRNADLDIAYREIMHLFLAHLLPAEDASDWTDRLLETFGGLGAVLAAPWSRLEQVAGEVEGLPSIIKTVNAIIVSVMREPLADRPVITSSHELHEYLRATLGHSNVEMVRILFLDTKNKLIKDELHGKGTINHVPLYPREVVKRAIELDAKAIILVHNHPSGDPSPSAQDVAITKQIAAVLGQIDIVFHDHVIVGRLRCASFRSLGLI